MAFPTNTLLEEVSQLKEVQQMKASAISSIKCGAAIGTSAIIGGILGGRVGLTIGGVVSSLIAASMASQDLKSVPLIIREMSVEDREKLAAAIRKLAEKHATTVFEFMRAIKSSDHLLQALLSIMITFLASNQGMEVHY